MFSEHSMKYVWYSPQKSKYPLFIRIINRTSTRQLLQNNMCIQRSSDQPGQLDSLIIDGAARMHNTRVFSSKYPVQRYFGDILN